MPKDKKMWDNILTVIMSLLCLLWIYPIVLILLNSLKMEGAGFGGNTNVVTVITEDFEKELGKLTKEETADRILDQILVRRGEN